MLHIVIETLLCRRQVVSSITGMAPPFVMVHSTPCPLLDHPPFFVDFPQKHEMKSTVCKVIFLNLIRKRWPRISPPWSTKISYNVATYLEKWLQTARDMCAISRSRTVPVPPIFRLRGSAATRGFGYHIWE
jgi:hypothetical protein